MVKLLVSSNMAQESGKDTANVPASTQPSSFKTTAYRKMLALGTVIVAGAIVAILRIQLPSTIPLIGHEQGVNSAVFSPDGTLVATGSDDGTIRIWQADGRPVRTITGHANRVTALAFAPSGEFLASASGIGNVRIWGVENGTEAAKFRAHEDCIQGLAFDASGFELFAVGWDSTFSLWNPFTEDLIKRRQSPAVAECCEFLPNENLLLAGCTDGVIRAWNLDDDSVSVAFDGHADQVKSIRVAKDGQTILSCGRDYSVQIWDMQSKRPSFAVRSNAALRGAVFLENETKVLVAGEDGELSLYDRASATAIVALRTKANSLLTLAEIDQNLIVTGGYDADAMLISVDSILADQH